MARNDENEEWNKCLTASPLNMLTINFSLLNLGMWFFRSVVLLSPPPPPKVHYSCENSSFLVKFIHFILLIFILMLFSYFQLFSNFIAIILQSFWLIQQKQQKPFTDFLYFLYRWIQHGTCIHINFTYVIGQRRTSPSKFLLLYSKRN